MPLDAVGSTFTQIYAKDGSERSATNDISKSFGQRHAIATVLSAQNQLGAFHKRSVCLRKQPHSLAHEGGQATCELHSAVAF